MGMLTNDKYKQVIRTDLLKKKKKKDIEGIKNIDIGLLIYIKVVCKCHT